MRNVRESGAACARERRGAACDGEEGDGGRERITIISAFI
jgi:hypothetical protein